MSRTEYEKKVMLTNTKSDVSVEADIDNFREGQRFDAFVATNKIPMKWNGKVYVGNMAGMEFISSGPHVYRINQGRQR